MLRWTFIIITTLCLSEYRKAEKSRKICEPNTYVIVGCNVCRCDDKGNINHEMCTKRTCENTRVNIEESRRTYSVNGSCEPGTWYSTEPCQFCYCVVKNKLLCNSNNDPQKLLLGKFDFTVCGTNLLQELSELAAEGKHSRHINEKKRRRKVARNIKHKKVRTTTTTKGIHTDELYEDVLKDINLNKNIERNGNYRESDYDDDDDDEYNSVREVGITELPYDDSDEYNRNVKLASDVEGLDSILDNDFSHKLLAGLQNNVKTKEPKLSEINFPQILNKFLNLKMRKSMLTIDENKQCTPGITYSSGCKKCFCLKNGKIICSSQLCI